MAEYSDNGTLHQLHDNTPAERAGARMTMAEAALRVTARRKKDRRRAQRDLTTVLLLLGLTGEEPEWFEEHLKFQKLYWLLGHQTQFKHRSET